MQKKKNVFWLFTFTKQKVIPNFAGVIKKVSGVMNHGATMVVRNTRTFLQKSARVINKSQLVKNESSQTRQYVGWLH